MYESIVAKKKFYKKNRDILNADEKAVTFFFKNSFSRTVSSRCCISWRCTAGSGYFGMFPLAYVPALWFRVMDPRLLALPHVRGDLSRINVDPKRRAALLRYAASASSA